MLINSISLCTAIRGLPKATSDSSPFISVPIPNRETELFKSSDIVKKAHNIVAFRKVKYQLSPNTAPFYEWELIINE